MLSIGVVFSFPSYPVERWRAQGAVQDGCAKTCRGLTDTKDRGMEHERVAHPPLSPEPFVFQGDTVLGMLGVCRPFRYRERQATCQTCYLPGSTLIDFFDKRVKYWQGFISLLITRFNTEQISGISPVRSRQSCRKLV